MRLRRPAALCPAGPRSPVGARARAASSRGLLLCDGIRHRLIESRRLGHVLTKLTLFVLGGNVVRKGGYFVQIGLCLSEHLADLQGIRSCDGFQRSSFDV